MTQSVKIRAKPFVTVCCVSKRTENSLIFSSAEKDHHHSVSLDNNEQ